jgi:hypothetical protein
MLVGHIPPRNDRERIMILSDEHLLDEVFAANGSDFDSGLLRDEVAKRMESYDSR